MENGEPKFVGDLVIRREEMEDIEDFLLDLSCACSFVVASVLRRKTKDVDRRRQMTEVVLAMTERILKDLYEEEEKTEAFEDSEERSLYEMMESIYEEWFASGCNYDEEGALIQACKAYQLLPQLVLDEQKGLVNVELVSADGTQHQLIDAVSLALCKENLSAAETTVFACEIILVVLMDRVYGEADNPLRKEGKMDFKEQLHCLLENNGYL